MREPQERLVRAIYDTLTPGQREMYERNGEFYHGVNALPAFLDAYLGGLATLAEVHRGQREELIRRLSSAATAVAE